MASRNDATASSRRHAGQSTDINVERFRYVLTALTGKTVFAKLRNQSVYTGIFHSCNIDKDFSIVLKYARELPATTRGEADTGPHARSNADTTKSGPVIPIFHIPGKDFLCIEANDMDVDITAGSAEDDALGVSAQPQGFKTDTAISSNSMCGKERALERWNDVSVVPEIDGKMSLEELDAPKNKSREKWNQFEQFQGSIKTTYDENLYTTKLDVDSIPAEKRKEAERIAREIEGGENYEERMREDEGSDEEAKFGAVLGTGAYKEDAQDAPGSDRGGGAKAAKKQEPRGAKTKAEDEKENTKEDKKLLSALRLSEDVLAQHEALQTTHVNSDFTQQHRTNRRLITNATFLHAPMVSEMKGINALNLEPALPKIDDKIKSDFVNFKQSQTRNVARQITGTADLKADFVNSLRQLKDRDAAKAALAAPLPPPPPNGDDAARQRAQPAGAHGVQHATPMPGSDNLKGAGRGVGEKKHITDSSPGSVPTLPYVPGSGHSVRMAALSSTAASSAMQQPQNASYNPNQNQPPHNKNDMVKKVDGFGFQFNAHAASFTPGNNNGSGNNGNASTQPDQVRGAQPGPQGGHPTHASTTSGGGTTGATTHAPPPPPSVGGAVPPHMNAPITSRGTAAMPDPQQAQHVQKSQTPSFASLHKKDVHIKSIETLLGEFCDRIMKSPRERGDKASPDWTEARGQSYKDILGSPSQHENTMQHGFSNFGYVASPEMNVALTAQQGGMPTHSAVPFSSFPMDNHAMMFTPNPNVAGGQNPHNAMNAMGTGQGMGDNRADGNTMMLPGGVSNVPGNPNTGNPAAVPHASNAIFMPQQHGQQRGVPGPLPGDGNAMPMAQPHQAPAMGGMMGNQRGGHNQLMMAQHGYMTNYPQAMPMGPLGAQGFVPPRPNPGGHVPQRDGMGGM